MVFSVLCGGSVDNWTVFVSDPMRLFATPCLSLHLFATPRLLVCFSLFSGCFSLFSGCFSLITHHLVWTRPHARLFLSCCSSSFASIAHSCKAASQTRPAGSAERNQYPFPFRSTSQILHFITFFNNCIPSFQY